MSLEPAHCRQRLQWRAQRLLDSAGAEDEEVAGEQDVKVLLLNQLHHRVQADQHGRAVERELHGLLTSDRLGRRDTRVERRLSERTVAADIDDGGGEHDHVQVRVRLHHRRDERRRRKHGVRDGVDHERAKGGGAAGAAVHNLLKVRRLQRGAADEEAVNVGEVSELGAICRAYRAAILDPQPRRHVGGAAGGDVCADRAVRFLRLRSCGDNAGADGPDGLIGENDARRINQVHHPLQLPLAHLQRPSGRALGL